MQHSNGGGNDQRDIEDFSEDYFEDKEMTDPYEKWIESQSDDELAQMERDFLEKERQLEANQQLPDLDWAKHIERISDPDIRDFEIRSVQDLIEQGDELKDIPDVPWSADIARIKDQEIREKEIKYGEKYAETEQDLAQKVKEGEISDLEYDLQLRPKRSSASTRCLIESHGMTYEDFRDIVEIYGLAAAGDLEAMDAKEARLLNREIETEEMVERMEDMKLDDEKIKERQ